MRDLLGDLEGHGLHVWRISTRQSDDVVRALEEHLSVEETRRADRYRRDLDRTRYVVAHGALRQLLAQYTVRRPREVSFAETETGKPFLVDERGEHCLRFNLSHSGDWAVVGVSLSADVGVDVERIDSEVSVEAVAERFLSHAEYEALRNELPEQRTLGFFTAWARKEAYLKARGEGIADRLRSFSVSTRPGQVPVLLTDSMDPSATLRWRIYDLDLACGYAAAIATEGITHRIREMNWVFPFVDPEAPDLALDSDRLCDGSSYRKSGPP